MNALAKLFDDELTLIFHKLDNSARLVGGCVRDYILYEYLVDDVDIATTFLPDEMCARLQDDFTIIPTGLKHGTITLVSKQHKNRKYEITTLRKDKETDGRHAIVAFDASWQEDSQRRDFTINALYLDIEGNIYDYHNGLKDLEMGLVKFIDNPVMRIHEDYLRIMRFFRFAMRFGKYDDASLAACIELAPNLIKISRERITSEWFNIIKGRYFWQMFDIFKPIADILKLKVRDAYNKEKLNIYGITALFWQPESMLLLSNEQKKYITNLQNLKIENQIDATIYMQKYGQDFIQQKMLFDNKFFEVLDLQNMPVDGNMIAARGYHGKEIGQILAQMKYIWVEKAGKIGVQELFDIVKARKEDYENKFV